MLQLILHGIGDYYFQTDFQALNKKKKGWVGLWACLKHCTTYSIPFFLLGGWVAVLAIFISHFVIDRTNIVAYLIAYKNRTYKNPEAKYHNYKWRSFDISNFGFAKERPFAITIWLYIICDNLLHIICNYLSLKYL